MTYTEYFSNLVSVSKEMGTNEKMKASSVGVIGDFHCHGLTLTALDGTNVCSNTQRKKPK